MLLIRTVLAAAGVATALSVPHDAHATGIDAPLAVLTAASVAETRPSAWAGDSIDDPAIWVNEADPSQSLVIGNDKNGALETYDLSGGLVQRITEPAGFFGNVDVRGNLVAVAKGGIRLFAVDPATRQLRPVTSGEAIRTAGEGLCMYDAGAPGLAGGLYVFTITRSVGRVRQYELRDRTGNGMLSGKVVRDFTIGTEAEGCAADDATGSLFVSEEDVALWRYGADPGAAASRTLVVPVGSQLAADAEGVTLAAGYLMVSAQNVTQPGKNFVNVYRATAPYTYVRSIRVVQGANSDDCDRTDGIAAYGGSLGAAFPRGLFVCQDGNNGAPGSSGNQNFKFVPLQAVLPL